MKYAAMPLLKLEVDGIKHAVLSHLGVVGSELGKALEEEVENAVQSFPWQEKVTEIVHNSINSRLKSYFQFGPGGKHIMDAVDEGFAAVLKKSLSDE